MADDALPLAEKGEPAVTAGVSGSGKLISSYSTGGADCFISGKTPADGNDTSKTNDDKSVAPCCR